MTAPLVLHFLDTEDTDLDETPEQAAKVEIIEYAVVRWTDGNAQAQPRSKTARLLTPCSS